MMSKIAFSLLVSLMIMRSYQGTWSPYRVKVGLPVKRVITPSNMVYFRDKPRFSLVFKFPGRFPVILPPPRKPGDPKFSPVKDCMACSIDLSAINSSDRIILLNES